MAWLDGGPPPSEALFAALRELGIAGTNVAGTASPAEQARHGIPYYVDHVAGKGDLFLDEEAWRGAFEGYARTREERFLVRPRSLADPAVVTRMNERMDAVLASALAGRPFALALDDEISLQRRSNAFDFDRSPALVAAWREDLGRRHRKRIEDLKRAWSQPDLPPFDQLEPPTTAATRERAATTPLGSWSFAAWNDWRAFQDDRFCDVVLALAERARERSGGLPTGFTGGGAPSPFSGLDWWRLARACRFLEPYDDGGTRALVGSWADPSSLLFHTLFRDPVDLRRDVHEIWEYALRGDAGLVVWSLTELFVDGDLERPSDFARAIAPTLRELSSDSLADFRRARPREPRIAILESRASVRAHWLLDSRGDGGSWIRRTSSWERENSTANRNREAWQKMLEDLHLDYRHVDTRDLVAGLPEAIEVLVLPRCIALSEAERVAISAFAREHVVIADAQPAILDGSLVAYPVSGLDLLFGVRRAGWEAALQGVRAARPAPLTRPGLHVAEPGLLIQPLVAGAAAADAARAALEIDGTPVLIERRIGAGPARDRKGLAIYLNLLLLDSLDRRCGGDEDADPPRDELREHLRAIFRRRGLLPAVRFDGPTPFPVRVFEREFEGRRFLAFHANGLTSTVPSRYAKAASKLTVRFDAPVRLRALRGDVAREASDANWRHALTLDPFEPTIVEVIVDNVPNR
ncbi:MAG: hypothetical protein R3F20_12620 [Planctomycetota bacterium]